MNKLIITQSSKSVNSRQKRPKSGVKKFFSKIPGYQKLINHIGSGDSESARELLENAGYSCIFADFLLDNAELDMRLQVLGDMLAVGGSDE